MSEAPELISLDDARKLVGEMLFGKDHWISELSKEQKNLLDSDFGPKRKAVFQAGVMLRDFIDVFNKPCPPERLQNLDLALGRAERMRIQGTTVDDWIETVAGLDCTKHVFKRADIDDAMTRHRAQSEAGDGIGRRRGPEPTTRDRVAEAMRRAIRDGQSTVAALKDAKEEALASTHSCSRETVRNARNLVLSEFVADGTATTPTNTDKRSQ
jgi:hypothetical protein